MFQEFRYLSHFLFLASHTIRVRVAFFHFNNFHASIILDQRHVSNGEPIGEGIEDWHSFTLVKAQGELGQFLLDSFRQYLLLCLSTSERAERGSVIPQCPPGNSIPYCSKAV